MNFTQGEWIINDYYKCIQNNPDDENDLGAICYFGNVPENESNMRLISCAPKMFKIIKKITKLLYKHNPTDKGKAYMKELISIIEKVTDKKWEEINNE